MTLRRTLFWLGALALLAAMPFLLSTFRVEQLTRIVVYAVFAASLDLLVGYCGLVSLGHAAFFGISAYAAALLSDRAGINNALLALPAGMLCAGVFAVLVGLITLRLQRIYFIMVTLAVTQIVFYVLNENAAFGGSDGILTMSSPVLRLGASSLDLSDPATRYLFVLAVAAVVLFLLARLVRSPFGRVAQGIRLNERRMRALGFRVALYKLTCFVIGSTLAGVAGTLYFLTTSFVDPTLTNWLQSAQLLVMVLLGGAGTLFGPVLAAGLIIVFVDAASDWTEHWRLLLGVVVIGVGMAGSGGLWAALTARWRLRPAAPRLEAAR